ncbi:MAG: toprim domain-containing protein, partial [Nitrosomonas sp.]
GTKLFAAGSKKEHTFHVVGANGLSWDKVINTAPAIIIAEGYATADTLSQALEIPVIAAFDSGNLPKVAQDLHAKFPSKPIIIAGDDDLHLESTQNKNPGREKALEAAQLVNGVAVFPVFAPNEQMQFNFSDFNDLANQSVLGLEAVKRQVGSVLNSAVITPIKNQANFKPQQLEAAKKRALVR